MVELDEVFELGELAELGEVIVMDLSAAAVTLNLVDPDTLPT